MGKSRTAIDRKMVKKRHRLTIGYLVFYAVMLALITVGLSLLLRGAAGSIDVNIPPFLYNSLLGLLYIYNSIAIVLRFLFFIIFPGVFQFKGLKDNSWNMLYKMDVRPGGLAMNRIQICIFSNLGIYLFGFILTAGIGFLLAGDMGAGGMMTIMMLALAGILALLLVMSVTLAVGTFTTGTILIRLSALLCSGLVVFCAYQCGYFLCADAQDIVNSTNKLISFNPLGLLLLPLALAAIFIPVALSTASARAKNYNTEELDDELLISLGIAENILLLEEGHNRYVVAISGPRINNADFDIEVPEMNQYQKA